MGRQLLLAHGAPAASRADGAWGLLFKESADEREQTMEASRITMGSHDGQSRWAVTMGSHDGHT